MLNFLVYILDRYGRKYVSKWRFETWNEPDLEGYNILNLTLPGKFNIHKYFSS